MRLLLVTTSFPESHGGEEAAGGFVYDFAHALGRHAKVEVVAPGCRDGVEVDGGITVHRFRAPRLPLSLLKAGRPGDWPAILRTLTAGGQAVDRVAERLRPDHALGLWALPSGAWLRRAGTRLGVPYSLWALGSDIWSLGRVPLVRRMLASVLRGAEHRFADGVELSAAVQELCGAPCQFLPSSRRLPVTDPASPRDVVPVRLGYLGRWHENKGTDLLLDALWSLDDDAWARIESVRINGGGPLAPRVEQGVARLRDAGRPVELGGYLDSRGAADLLSWSDYLVIPSRIESVPVIFSDAMQARCPVISMPVGDLPQLINRYQVGVTAASVDAAALARAIAEATRRPASVHGDGLEEAARAFDVDHTAATLMALLEGVAR